MFDDKIEEIDTALREVLDKRAPRDLHDACAYLPLAGGKRLRPLLALLSCGAFSDHRKALPFGISLELIHNFTLMHDDLMDRDALRRGIKTTHVVYGEPLAILAGDTLYSMAFEHIAESYGGPLARALVQQTAHMTLEICHGQSLDMAYERGEPTEEEYLEMVYKKTAVFFERAALCGAIIGGGNENAAKDLGEMGRDMGIGFQLWDDLLSIVGKEEQTGKRVGNDIVRGKRTLVIIRAKQRGVNIKALGKYDASDEDVREAIKQLEDCGAVDEVRRIADGYFSRAVSMAITPELKAFIENIRGREK
jgi:geranylgeranyl diphosphate synthase type I